MFRVECAIFDGEMPDDGPCRLMCTAEEPLADACQSAALTRPASVTVGGIPATRIR